MRFLSFAFWVVLGFDVFLVFVGIKPGIIDPDFARMQAETVKEIGRASCRERV